MVAHYQRVGHWIDRLAGYRLLTTTFDEPREAPLRQKRKFIGRRKADVAQPPPDRSARLNGRPSSRQMTLVSNFTALAAASAVVHLERLIKCAIFLLKGATMAVTPHTPTSRKAGKAIKVSVEKPGERTREILGRAGTQADAIRAVRIVTQGREGLDVVSLYKASPYDRIATVKAGLPAQAVKVFVGGLDMPFSRFFDAVQLSPATFNRKVIKGQPLSTDESERVAGFAKLFGQVQVMVEESGDMDGFDARAWTLRWLNEPLPALNGARPVEMLDTIEGQHLVAAALARIQTGAYA